MHKVRDAGGIAAIATAEVLGTWQAVAGVLPGSEGSRTINMSFIEQQHGTGRHQNAGESRLKYRFSKD
jgi:hypothetical protein